MRLNDGRKKTVIFVIVTIWLVLGTVAVVWSIIYPAYDLGAGGEFDKCLGCSEDQK
jgi:hypothetical protein